MTHSLKSLSSNPEKQSGLNHTKVSCAKSSREKNQCFCAYPAERKAVVLRRHCGAALSPTLFSFTARSQKKRFGNVGVGSLRPSTLFSSWQQRSFFHCRAEISVLLLLSERVPPPTRHKEVLILICGVP